MVNHSSQLSRLFFALSDPTRMAMVERLGTGVASVSELARPLDMSMAAVVQHVKVLVDSGLICTKKMGRVRHCSLNPDALESVSAWIERHGWSTIVTPELSNFLSELDMFYLGTSNAEGQPYIQYRGGSPGFLRPLDERTLGFADFAGNQQYITLGNLSENPKAYIFLMDYANSRRVKLWGTARVVENDSGLLDRLQDPAYSAKAERAILFEIKAWDVNCPQHIHKRFPQIEAMKIVEELQNKIKLLEQQLAMAKTETT